MPTTSIFALGAPDGRYFSLGWEGDVCLQRGPRPGNPEPAGQRQSRSLTATASRTATGCTPPTIGAACGNRLGHANGTASFRHRPSGLELGPAICGIVCDSTSSPSDPNAGLDLDARGLRRSSRSGSTRPSPLAPRPSPALFPNPVGRVLRVALPAGECYLKFIDIGAAVKCYPFATGEPDW